MAPASPRMGTASPGAGLHPPIGTQALTKPMALLETRDRKR